MRVSDQLIYVSDLASVACSSLVPLSVTLWRCLRVIVHVVSQVLMQALCVSQDHANMSRIKQKIQSFKLFLRVYKLRCLIVAPRL